MSYTYSMATERVELTDEQKARVAQRARRDLLRVLLSQLLASVFVAGLFGLVSGKESALSALLGASCYLLPNALFVLRLLLGTFRPQGAGTGTFLIGSALKVLTAIGLLWLLADQGAGQLDWVAVLVGLIAALKGYWFGLLLTGGKLSK